MIYQFGACTYDTTSEQVRRAGELVSVEPQVLSVLRYLLKHRDRVVSRDELFEQCWPETYVSDASLTSCMRRVRAAIGQRGGQATPIETVHRRGYRFVGEVYEVAFSSTPASPFDTTLKCAHASEGEAGEPLPEPPTPASLTAAETAIPPDRAAMAERRHLSVLSCRLCDIEALADQLDPDDHYELMRRFSASCEAVVLPYEGHIVQQLTDGVLVYFGYPKVHEDEALRAVRAGLALVSSIGRELSLSVRAWLGPPLAVRVGIASGAMIVPTEPPTDMSSPLGVGRVLTQALRLAALAEPSAVVISETTAQLVSGYVECKVLAHDPPSGEAVSEVVYDVLGESALQTPLEVRAIRGLTPFVGREAELALLQERWADVHEGRGQVVWIQGEAGLGKSRLVDVFKAQMAGKPLQVLACRCSPYHQFTAFYPLIDLLQQAMLAPPASASGSLLEALEALLRQYSLGLDETVPLLAGLLSLSLPSGRYAPLTLTPQRQRERTLEVLWALLQVQTSTWPLLFVVEDVHWIDPSTLDFLQLVLTQVASASMLVVLTSRPELEATWGQGGEITKVVLHPLTRAQTEAMIVQVAGGKSLPGAVLAQVVEKTDGVPLFVEELTRMMLESGELVERQGQYELVGKLSALTIPLTLHDSLMARLDRLDVGKELAQWGSVLGREFSYDVLQAVVPDDEATLQSGLRELAESGLVLQRGIVPRSRYRFKHALIQDAAYDALPRRRRQAMHGQVAQAFERQFPALVETQPEVLAHHLTEADLVAQAIGYWYRAGQRARERSANAEAIAHLRQGLNFLQDFPETPERLQQELKFQVALGPALIVTQGEGAADVGRTYARARELCQQVGDTPQLFQVLRGLVLYYLTQVDLQIAHQLAQELLRLSHSQADSVLRMFAHHLLGMVLFYWGKPIAAHTHHLQVLPLYRPREHRALALRYGLDLGVGAHNFLAWELWHLGYPDQAVQHIQAAHTLAQEVAHPYSLCLTLVNTARVHQHRRETLAVLEQTETLMTLATEQGFAQWLIWGTILHGWALALQGQENVGIDEIRQGLGDHWDTRGKVTQPYFLGLLAEAYGANGHPEAGLEVLAEALAVMDDIEMRFCAAELYRLMGVLLLQQAVPNAPQAEACFYQALDIAREQQAKSWELRVVTSLARLWQQQDRRRDAYDLLAPVYAWFCEGFDTADLQEAELLLIKLK